MLLLILYILLGLVAFLWGAFFLTSGVTLSTTWSVTITIFCFMSFVIHLLFQLVPSPNRPASTKVLLAIISVLFIPILVIVFAHTYRSFDLTNVTQDTDYIYFSIVTFTTLGYGDISPKGWARLFAVLQAISGFLFVPLLISQLWSASKDAENEKKQNSSDVLERVREVIRRSD